ncbi:M15 family metallopeptidase [Aquimarina sp. W85]|uniref:M15 family metallopeptidase n=1 Tax=Aquimarina rhodophyticola TaxID=3342246 RepID=UPI00366AACD9
MFFRISLCISVFLIGACTIYERKKDTQIVEDKSMHSVTNQRIDEESKASKKKLEIIKPAKNEVSSLYTLPDTTFVNILDYSRDFTLNIKYATSNNFLKTAVYDCAACYVRAPVASALIKANASLMALGYRLQFFDCYRPHSVQKKMWEIFPKPGYVANPKGGSIHNKGAAVDLTITKLDGTPIDMGSAYDHFGWKSHHAYPKLPKNVMQHRTLLKETMLNFGFKTIRREWWHYNYQGGRRYPISDFKWKCS